tara:strand:- start:1291 stop:2043 length:753 start_codon:yes stop_codon:yes gene_type:complete
MNELITNNSLAMDQLVESLKAVLEEEKKITPDLVDDPNIRSYLDELYPETPENRDRFLRLCLMQVATKCGELNLLKIDNRIYKDPEQMTAAELITAKAKAEERKRREDTRHGINMAKIEDREEELGLFGKEEIDKKNYGSKLEKHFFRYAKKHGLELKAQYPIKNDDQNLRLDYMVMDQGEVTPLCVEIMSRAYHVRSLSQDYERSREVMAKNGVIFVFLDADYIFRKPAAAVKQVLRIYKTMKRKFFKS